MASLSPQRTSTACSFIPCVITVKLGILQLKIRVNVSRINIEGLACHLYTHYDYYLLIHNTHANDDQNWPDEANQD